jgi:hypothetical protein
LLPGPFGRVVAAKLANQKLELASLDHNAGVDAAEHEVFLWLLLVRPWQEALAHLDPVNREPDEPCVPEHLPAHGLLSLE